MEAPWFRSSVAPAALLLLAALVPGCSTPTQVAEQDPLAGLPGRWTLVELEGRPVDVEVDEEGERPGLSLTADGGLSGSTGLNRFRGGLDPTALRAGRFEAGPLAGTRRAGPPEAMDLERRYLQALELAERWWLEGGALLLARGDERLARFMPARSSGPSE